MCRFHGLRVTCITKLAEGRASDPGQSSVLQSAARPTPRRLPRRQPWKGLHFGCGVHFCPASPVLSCRRFCVECPHHESLKKGNLVKSTKMRAASGTMVLSNRIRVYDALVVGSGASGGWVAKELTEQGMDVLMLEAGPPRIPTRDFTEHVWPSNSAASGTSERCSKGSPSSDLLRLRRIQSSLLRQRSRASIHLSAGQAFHVDSRPPDRWQDVLLGARELPLQ